MKYKRVLVPIEPNSMANQILVTAASIGKGADLHIIYVAKSLRQDYEYVTAPSMIELIDEFTESAQRVAGERINEIVGRSGAKAASEEVAFGNPAKQILSAAEALNADLIVIGAHNRSAFSLLGSTASKILRLARCDVLTVHSHG